MNKFSNWAYAAFLALTLLSAVGCTSSAKHESTGQYIDDSIITTKVKAAIFKEPSLKTTEINVETFKGIVQLSGFVHDASDVNKATEIARMIKGVSSVKSSIQVK
ncbi:MAG: hyperosmotically inducible protein [Marinomonas primoryensis]|jgi:osmotically-inducible protein OsmY